MDDETDPSGGQRAAGPGETAPADGTGVTGDGRDSPYGDTWVYESIVGALPGVSVSAASAIAIQFVTFQTGILVLALWYDLWEAALAGTAAVIVATGGSFVMSRMGTEIRALDAPLAYRRLLFGSSVEVVLGVLAFVALVTHLFVFDPGQGGTPLVESLFGPDPPLVVVYLALLVLWDLAYRIGTSWWASVVAVWRSYVYDFDPATAAAYRQIDAYNVAFGLLQLLLVPFLLDHPVLLTVVLGHVGAVTGAAALSVVLLWAGTDRRPG